MVRTRMAIVDPERQQLGLHHVGPTAVPRRVDAPVVGQQRRRITHRPPAPRKTSRTPGAVATANTLLATARREWSSTKFTISTSVPSARRQYVTSDCLHSLGSRASKRVHELRAACGAAGLRSHAGAAPATSWGWAFSLRGPQREVPPLAWTPAQ